MRKKCFALLVLVGCSGSPPPSLEDPIVVDASADQGVSELDASDAQAPHDAWIRDAFVTETAAETGPASDAGAPETGSSLGWPSPCASCVNDAPKDCAGIGGPDAGPYRAFTCAMACSEPPPTLTSGPSGCYYVGPIGPATFEMCCPASNPF